LADDPPSEKTVRDSVQRLRKTAARLSDRLKQSSDKIDMLDEAASHPERAVRAAATKIPR
jgi:5-methylcytosine-specific restriction endonuclease McrBC regulatory subunit McrC